MELVMRVSSSASLGLAGVAMVSESFSSFIFRATSAGIGVFSNCAAFLT